MFFFFLFSHLRILLISLCRILNLVNNSSSELVSFNHCCLTSFLLCIVSSQILFEPWLRFRSFCAQYLRCHNIYSTYLSLIVPILYVHHPVGYNLFILELVFNIALKNFAYFLVLQFIYIKSSSRFWIFFKMSLELHFYPYTYLVIGDRSSCQNGVEFLYLIYCF